MVKKCMFIIMVILAVAAGFMIYVRENGIEGASNTDIGISAGQAILINGDTGEVLYEKASKEKAYPASTTKIMTAMVVMDVLKKYESPITQTITVPDPLTAPEGSSLYLKAGEQITIEDLLYGMMMVSGNDAAVVLAQTIGGSEEKFVQMMNEKAENLGCRDTHFVNPHGLFDEDHYTTAEDMAVIAMAAMEYPKFREIVAAKTYDSTRENREYKTFYNKNKTIYDYEGGNGIKIGYTMDSGRTLVASSKRGKHELICVVMSAPNWFDDAYRLMDYGYTRLK